MTPILPSSVMFMLEAGYAAHLNLHPGRALHTLRRSAVSPSGLRDFLVDILG
jgi:hypothetical protein